MYILFRITLFSAMNAIYVSQNPGICSNVSNREPLECCPNYRIFRTKCEECWPGSRGVDCKEDCAPGFYGRLCRERCSCDPCDKVKGCQNVTREYIYHGLPGDAMLCQLRVMFLPIICNAFSQRPGICSSDSQGIQVSCCRNYQLIENDCKECPYGSYGDNCTEVCPSGFYGQFCREKCSCDSCDKIHGCLNMTDSKQFQWTIIFLSCTGSVAICLIFCMSIICILRKRKQENSRCVVPTIHGEDLKASEDENEHNYLEIESYNVLKLTIADK